MSRADILKINWDIARARVDQLESQVRDLTGERDTLKARDDAHQAHYEKKEEIINKLVDSSTRLRDNVERLERELKEAKKHDGRVGFTPIISAGG